MKGQEGCLSITFLGGGKEKAKFFQGACGVYLVLSYLFAKLVMLK